MPELEELHKKIIGSLSRSNMQEAGSRVSETVIEKEADELINQIANHTRQQVLEAEMRGEKLGELSHQVGLFWAFSNEQFKEGAESSPLKEGEKYVSIGAGGYMPKGNVDRWITGMRDIEAWKKAEVKKNKSEQEATILYELNNYECFYTGDIEDALPVLKDLGFTEKQVKTVYHKNREFALN